MFSVQLSLLGFADPKYPSYEAANATIFGWLVFGIVVALLLFCWTRAESIRRGLLGLEDPRTYAVLRIGFALMTMACFLNLQPHWLMLWTDEGLFDLAYAREKMGRTALRGWSPEDGFYDLWGLICFLWNDPSLLYMYSSPGFVYGYIAVFMGVLLLYALGLWSRITGVLAWFMMIGLYNRSSLYLEGTDTVYQAFWFILIFAQTGYAWSLDNWWRCRKLRARGQLMDPDATDADNEGKQPIYRLAPAWPRWLFMLQLVAVYTTTGAVKTGSVWWAGDALYYALNLDHFYRFEYATQWVSSLFGLNLFRINSWVTHWWERLFALVFLGVLLDFGRRSRNEAWYRRQMSGWRAWLGYAALVTAYVLLWSLIRSAIPYCYPLHGERLPDVSNAQRWVTIVFAGVIPALTAAWVLLGRRPITLLAAERTWGRWKIPPLVLDQDAFRAVLLGRRVWLTVGAIFHGFLILFMNIGMFPFIMLMTYAGFLRGEELASSFRRLSSRWAKCPPWVRTAVHPNAAKPSPTTERRLPDGLVLILGVVAIGLVLARIQAIPGLRIATYGWIGATLLAAGIVQWRFVQPIPAQSPRLAYSPLGRTIALGFILWHCTAVSIRLFPAFPVFSTWRTPTLSIFSHWLKATSTSQGWRMFSPNPPRSNVFMRTVVALENGDEIDLKGNVFHYDLPVGPASRPNPWIFNDRIRKMQRRMVGKGKWYLPYWAGYQCRQWALKHHGELPAEIRISKFVTRIPSPNYISFFVEPKYRDQIHPSHGARSGHPYNPRKLKVKEVDVKTHKCEAEDVPPWLKERYALPISSSEKEDAKRQQDAMTLKDEQHRSRWESRRDFPSWWTSKPKQAASTTKE